MQFVPLFAVKKMPLNIYRGGGEAFKNTEDNKKETRFTYSLSNTITCPKFSAIPFHAH